MVLTAQMSSSIPHKFYFPNQLCESMMGTAAQHNNSNNSTLSTFSATTQNINMNTHGPSKILQLLRKCNSFMIQGLRSSDGSACLPLVVGETQIGTLRRDVVGLLARYPAVFTVKQTSVVLNPLLNNYSSRSAAVAAVLEDLREGGETAALRAWRGENFFVWGQYGEDPIMEVERSAMALLGVRSFGVHCTGFVRRQDGVLDGLWLQQRAMDKPTYPGMMDTMVGGGMTAGLTASQVLVKEAAEEASLPEHIVRRAMAAGTVSFFRESPRGIHANTEHVYEVELPPGFRPTNNDGEVQGFIYVPIENILDYLLDPNFKLSSAPILVDFLIRHGIINADTVPDLPEISEMMHVPLSLFYRIFPTFPAQDNQNDNNPSPTSTETLTSRSTSRGRCHSFATNPILSTTIDNQITTDRRRSVSNHFMNPILSTSTQSEVVKPRRRGNFHSHSISLVSSTPTEPNIVKLGRPENCHSQLTNSAIFTSASIPFANMGHRGSLDSNASTSGVEPRTLVSRLLDNTGEDTDASSGNISEDSYTSSENSDIIDRRIESEEDSD